MTDSKLLLDTCIWVGYFKGDTPKSKEIIESKYSTNFTSVLSIFEFMRKMSERKIPDSIIANMIEIIEEMSLTIDINKKIAKSCSSNSTKYRLSSIDSLLYTTAQIENLTFITTDKHFSKTPNTILLKFKK